MSGGSLAIHIDSVRGGSRTSRTDCVAVEEPLEIQLCSRTATNSAARAVSITMRTPGEDADLALGFLLGESIIRSYDDVESIAHCGPRDPASGERNSIRIELKPGVDVDLGRLERHFYSTSSCGVCGKASLDALRVTAPRPVSDSFSVARQTLVGLPGRLRERQRLFASTGGLHAAAAFDADGELAVVREDVGRHNAVDKVVGALLRDYRVPASDFGLIVSGRASFELMQKALVAGFPLLAAVSAPSSLAVHLAREFDLSLVGFLRDADFNIYAGAQRIAGEAA